MGTEMKTIQFQSAGNKMKIVHQISANLSCHPHFPGDTKRRAWYCYINA
jgi:hypothetical protein